MGLKNSTQEDYIYRVWGSFLNQKTLTKVPIVISPKPLALRLFYSCSVLRHGELQRRTGSRLPWSSQLHGYESRADTRPMRCSRCCYGSIPGWWKCGDVWFSQWVTNSLSSFPFVIFFLYSILLIVYSFLQLWPSYGLHRIRQDSEPWSSD